jgi:hypothetical protein
MVNEGMEGRRRRERERERDPQSVTFALKHDINRPGTGVYNPATASLG